MDAAPTAIGPIILVTPVGEEVLILRSMEGNEIVDSPFKLELVAICADPSAMGPTCWGSR